MNIFHQYLTLMLYCFLFTMEHERKHFAECSSNSFHTLTANSGCQSPLQKNDWFNLYRFDIKFKCKVQLSTYIHIKEIWELQRRHFQHKLSKIWVYSSYKAIVWLQKTWNVSCESYCLLSWCFWQPLQCKPSLWGKKQHEPSSKHPVHLKEQSKYGFGTCESELITELSFLRELFLS